MLVLSVSDRRSPGRLAKQQEAVVIAECPKCGEPTVENRVNCPKCGAAYPDMEEHPLEMDPERQGEGGDTTTTL